jgi:hypothetical protein
MNSNSLLPHSIMLAKLILYLTFLSVHMVNIITRQILRQSTDENSGKTPAIALFATFARYKREAYRASEFAPKILARNGITVLMKVSGHRKS